MKYFSCFLFLFFGLNVFSQNNNSEKYEYIIVESNFDFAKKRDAYGTSSLTKFLFNKIGFKSYLDDDVLPTDLATNRCKALTASVLDKSGSLTIRTVIELKDCQGRVVFTSEPGKSKIKNYRRGYYQSINLAFKSVKLYKHKYERNLTAGNNINSVSKTDKVDSNLTENKEIKKSVTVKKEKTPKEVLPKKTYKKLYSKEIKNGFQLLDDKSQIIFVLLRINQKDKFIIKDKNGTLTKKNGYWLAEYYKDGELITEKYQINF